jgi:hypothetical protein
VAIFHDAASVSSSSRRWRRDGVRRNHYVRPHDGLVMACGGTTASDRWGRSGHEGRLTTKFCLSVKLCREGFAGGSSQQRLCRECTGLCREEPTHDN